MTTPMLHAIITMSKVDRVLLDGKPTRGYIHGANLWRVRNEPFDQARPERGFYAFRDQPVVLDATGTTTLDDTNGKQHTATFLKMKPATTEDLQ